MMYQCFYTLLLGFFLVVTDAVYGGGISFVILPPLPRVVAFFAINNIIDSMKKEGLKNNLPFLCHD